MKMPDAKVIARDASIHAALQPAGIRTSRSTAHSLLSVSSR